MNPETIGETTTKVAVLGGGSHSAVGRAHISAIRLLGNVHIQAGCFSRDPVKNHTSALAYGLKPQHIYPSLDVLIEQERRNISTVIVLTPIKNHFEDVRNILESGLNVVCEKSLCTTSNEARELISIADRNNVKLFVIFNYTGYPMIREIREFVKQGKLGKVHTINAIMPQESFSKKNLDGKAITPQEWRLVDAFIPTISLDLGVHLTNLVSFATNLEFEDILAVQNKRGNFDVVDDVHAISRLSNLGICNLWDSKAALGNRNGLAIELYGEKGSIVWSQENPEQFMFSDEYGNQNLINRGTQGLVSANLERYLRFKPGHPSGFIEAFANYYEDIFNQLQSLNEASNQYTFNAVDALNGLLVMEAIATSSESGGWEAVNVS